jgi:hypothetical protein
MTSGGSTCTHARRCLIVGEVHGKRDGRPSLVCRDCGMARRKDFGLGRWLPVLDAWPREGAALRLLRSRAARVTHPAVQRRKPRLTLHVHLGR